MNSSFFEDFFEMLKYYFRFLIDILADKDLMDALQYCVSCIPMEVRIVSVVFVIFFILVGIKHNVKG